MRIGHGYDVHRLVSGRKLILGGVEIPNDRGLLGHSDADVLVHAIMDALLGASALGDLGSHFPDTDMSYKDVSSIVLLKEVRELLRRKNYSVLNIDSTIVAQSPKLAPYIPEMKENISKALEIDPDNINIKATTEEGLGISGTGDGIVSHAVCLIERI
ncbi:MAG: 2-C-methyl-D-erythritol 2,4-cyclodiphosphate synthase [Clostridiales bacterium]|jgi:2-C-methyl-D-erythritol 2,4-cyclodiphosphate synthase|nr:2-C-methyl-D-erythritol 2,4-cyclodiphosphate synthase [Clostridiales bacterium]